MGAGSSGVFVREPQAQTQWGVEHLIVVDGPKYAPIVREILKEFEMKKPILLLVLPFNTGKGGWNGHRIYASMPFLADAFEPRVGEMGWRSVCTPSSWSWIHFTVPTKAIASGATARRSGAGENARTMPSRVPRTCPPRLRPPPPLLLV